MKGYILLGGDMRLGKDGTAWEQGERRVLVEGSASDADFFCFGKTLWVAFQTFWGAVAALIEADEPIEMLPAAQTGKCRSCRVLDSFNMAYHLRVFAADCAMRVLPNFEAEFKHDGRVFAAIMTALEFTKGLRSRKELEQAGTRAFLASEQADNLASHYAALSAGACASFVPEYRFAGVAWALESVGWACENRKRSEDSPSPVSYSEARMKKVNSEYGWQRQHFESLIRPDLLFRKWIEA